MDNKQARIAALTDAELAHELAVRVMGWLPTEMDGIYRIWDKEIETAVLSDMHLWSPPTSVADAALCTERMIATGRIEIHQDKCLAYVVAPIGDSDHWTTIYITEHKRRERAEAEAALMAKLNEIDSQ